MKKIILIFVLCLSFIGVFAQDAANLKNAGNAALKAKDYKTAFENYEKFMQAPDTFEDMALVFNTAYCASKIKNYEKAVKYFNKSIENKYKLASSYQRKALALKRLKKTNEMVSTLETGIKACPGKNAKMITMLSKHFLIQGQKFQKSNKVDDAVKSYTKAIELNSKKTKTNALFSLGALYYNEGAKVLQAATPIANTEPEKYKAESVKAKDFFKKALVELNKAKEIDPSREDVTGTIKQVSDLLK